MVTIANRLRQALHILSIVPKNNHAELSPTPRQPLRAIALLVYILLASLSVIYVSTVHAQLFVGDHIF